MNIKAFNNEHIYLMTVFYIIILVVQVKADQNGQVLSVPYLIIDSRIQFESNNVTSFNCDKTFSDKFNQVFGQFLGQQLKNLKNVSLACTTNTSIAQPVDYTITLAPKDEKDVINLKYYMSQIIQMGQSSSMDILFMSNKTSNNQTVWLRHDSLYASLSNILNRINILPSCQLLRCDNPNFVPVCDDSLTDEFECVHLCDTTNDYCLHNGLCVISHNLLPLCFCNTDDNDWSLNVNYSGLKCEIEHYSIPKALFILIITLVSLSLVTMLAINILIAIYVYRKRSNRVFIS